MDSSGRINALGEQYIGARASNISANSTPGIVDGGSGSSTNPSLESVAVVRWDLSRVVPLLLLPWIAMACLLGP